MKTVLAYCVSISAILNGAVIAQDTQTPDDGMYFRIGGGINFLSDWEQDYTFNPDLVFAGGPPAGQMIENGKGFAASAALGFDYADGIRTELEYRYAKSGIDSAIVNEAFGPAPLSTVNDDIMAHLLMSNFYFDFYNASPFTPFIGGGVGGAFVESENADRDAALAWQVRGGLSYAIGDNFFADVEYVYLRSNKLDFGPNAEDFTPDGPFDPAITGDRYRSSTAMISLRKHF